MRRPWYQRRRTVELGPPVEGEQPDQGFKVIFRGRGTEKLTSGLMFEIELDGRKVAEFATDCRGESPTIRKPYGGWVGFDYIHKGGGPEPLRLTKRGTECVEAFLAGRSLPPIT
jgi:hypothetical protein